MFLVKFTVLFVGSNFTWPIFKIPKSWPKILHPIYYQRGQITPSSATRFAIATQQCVLDPNTIKIWSRSVNQVPLISYKQQTEFESFTRVQETNVLCLSLYIYNIYWSSNYAGYRSVVFSTGVIILIGFLRMSRGKELVTMDFLGIDKTKNKASKIKYCTPGIHEKCME